MPDNIAIAPIDQAPIDPSDNEATDEELDSMFSDDPVGDEKKPAAARGEKGRFVNQGKGGGPDDAERGDPKANESEEIEVPGIGKVAVSEIQKWRSLQEKQQEIEAKASDLEAQLEEAGSLSEQLEVWKKMDSLAARFPKVKQRFNEVLKEFAESGDFGEEDSSGQASGLDVSFLKGRSEKEEVDPEIEADRRFVREQRMEKVGNEIKGLLTSVNEEYPGVVKVDSQGNIDKEWMKNTLAPAVRERFGDNVDLRHIRMTLNDMIVTGGAIKRAKEEGASELAAALARQPRGTVVLPPGGSKKQTVQPEPDWSKKSMQEIANSITEDDSIYQK